jgi:hypothetical protein
VRSEPLRFNHVPKATPYTPLWGPSLAHVSFRAKLGLWVLRQKGRSHFSLSPLAPNFFPFSPSSSSFPYLSADAFPWVFFAGFLCCITRYPETTGFCCGAQTPSGAAWGFLVPAASTQEARGTREVEGGGGLSMAAPARGLCGGFRDLFLPT